VEVLVAEEVLDFYEALADHYHLIFDDWDRAIDRQAYVLGPLIASHSSKHPLKILDCSCGIETQAIGFAKMGHVVVASDLSPAAVAHARCEAERRSLIMSFHVSDMTSLAEINADDFDVVASLDNALPHLTAPQLGQATQAIASKLKPGGLFLASIRDYDALQHQKPTMQQPTFYGEPGERRIVHQVWDWIDDTRYLVHLYLTLQSGQRWQTHHFVSEYRCLPREELSMALTLARFSDIRWLMPPQSSFYQPIILARRPA